MIILSFMLAILLLYILNCFQKQEINRLNNIINEVREYISNTELGKGTEYYRIQILQILDKELKGEKE